jgi:hypothetical protein
MGKAIFHAQESAKIFGGKPEDYLDIHEFIDSNRSVFGDHRHRALTHHTFFLTTALPLKFGQLRTNSDNKEYSVLEVGEQHVREDFGGMIPSPRKYKSNWGRPFLGRID